jgi:hypothetical protein
MSSRAGTKTEDGGTEGARHLPMSSLLNFLTPPAGYATDRGLCSAYSAQCAVLVSMLAAMIRQGPADGTSASALALARALQRLEGKVHFLLQHGRFTAPRNASAIVNLLDRMIVPMAYDERSESWHPKVCIVRYTRNDSDQKAPALWRLWIGSRNFTRDDSWDMALSLTGAADGLGVDVPGTVELAGRLAAAANVGREWNDAIKDLRCVRWDVPRGLHVERLALLLPGDEARDLEPAPPRSRGILAVSPFIDAWATKKLLEALPAKRSANFEKPRLISTEPSMVDVARTNLAAFEKYNTLSLSVSEQDGTEDEVKPTDDDDADDGPEARGLHAKFIWIETPGRAELRLGSTNLTQRGWQSNAEALAVVSVSLPGGPLAKALKSGLDAFEALSMPYTPPSEPAPLDAAEQLERKFERLRQGLVATFQLNQSFRGGRCVLVAQAAPMTGEATVRVGRVGSGALQTWPAGATEIVLPPAPMHESGDFIQLELTWGELRSAWLHHAPFDPPLSREARDQPLLRACLGFDGVLALLNDCLTIGGNTGGERLRWDLKAEPQCSPLPGGLLGIESVLASWMRDHKSLRDVRQVVALVRACTPGEADQRQYRQLQEFLASWDAVEKELVPP